MSATSTHAQCEMKRNWWFTNRGKSWVIETPFSRFVKRAAKRTSPDDTTLFYSSNSIQDLDKTINEEFNHLLSYCSANKLSVNFKKTHCVIIFSPQKANKRLIYTILKKRTSSNTKEYKLTINLIGLPTFKTAKYLKT